MHISKPLMIMALFALIDEINGIFIPKVFIPKILISSMYYVNIRKAKIR